MKLGPFTLFQKRVITNTEHGVERPYLVRYELIKCARFGLYLHHILRSDADRDLHDHPWPFTSIVLRGGYLEHLPHGQWRWCGAGSIIRHAAGDLHRLELTQGPAWTFVFIGRRQRKWGFQTPRGWVHWKQYLAEKEQAVDHA